MNRAVPSAIGTDTARATRAMKMVMGRTAAIPKWWMSGSHAWVVRKLESRTLQGRQRFDSRNKPTATVMARTVKTGQAGEAYKDPVTSIRAGAYPAARLRWRWWLIGRLDKLNHALAPYLTTHLE